jgi:hypothetical protein
MRHNKFPNIKAYIGDTTTLFLKVTSRIFRGLKRAVFAFSGSFAAPAPKKAHHHFLLFVRSEIHYLSS